MAGVNGGIYDVLVLASIVTPQTTQHALCSLFSQYLFPYNTMYTIDTMYPKNKYVSKQIYIQNLLYYMFTGSGFSSLLKSQQFTTWKPFSAFNFWATELILVSKWPKFHPLGRYGPLFTIFETVKFLSDKKSEISWKNLIFLVFPKNFTNYFEIKKKGTVPA